MTGGPRNATTSRSGSRFYSWRDENFWSVTTLISGGLPKPALIHWSANEVAAFACDNHEAVGGLLAAEGGRAAAYDLLKRSPWRKKEKAADIGTAIHLAIEAHTLGKPAPPWGILERPYMEWFERFLADFTPQFLATEATVYNRTERYAGTLDAIVEMTLPLSESPRRYIMDAKSGKNVYPEVGLQLAAYRYAEFIGAPDGSEQPMPTVDGALALHLTPHGYRLIEVLADEVVFRHFLYCRENYRFMNEIAKTVLGAEYTPEPTAKEVTAA